MNFAGALRGRRGLGDGRRGRGGGGRDARGRNRIANTDRQRLIDVYESGGDFFGVS